MLELAPGVAVVLVGLNSTPELNDARGVISRWDAGLGRWRVRMGMDGEGKTRALRTENLRVDEAAEK